MVSFSDIKLKKTSFFVIDYVIPVRIKVLIKGTRFRCPLFSIRISSLTVKVTVIISLNETGVRGDRSTVN